MISDDELTAALTPAVHALPFAGRWLAAPFSEPVAVIARDHDFAEIRLDRTSGLVQLVDLDSEHTSLLAPSLSGLTAAAEAYAAALAATPDADDDDLEQLADQLRDRLRAIEPRLLDDENGFWTEAVEDLEFGLVDTSDE